MSIETINAIEVRLYKDFVALPKNKNISLGRVTQLFYQKYPEFKQIAFSPTP